MNNTTDKQFEQQLRSTLDQSIAELDSDIQYRLQMARAQVLQNSVIPWYQQWATWASVAGVMSVCVLTFTLFSNTSLFNEPAATNLAINIEGNIFDGDASIELYEEYDFYVWLAHQESSS